MNSKRRHEGYLCIDHSASPGLPMPGGRGLFEVATITCSHCCKVLIVNPLRTRERGYCAKCDHYICDECNAIRVANGGVCKTFNQIIEEGQEAAVKAEQRGIIFPRS